jgi:hypothetical protein
MPLASAGGIVALGLGPPSSSVSPASLLEDNGKQYQEPNSHSAQPGVLKRQSGRTELLVDALRLRDGFHRRHFAHGRKISHSKGSERSGLTFSRAATQSTRISSIRARRARCDSPTLPAFWGSICVTSRGGLIHSTSHAIRASGTE